MTLTFGFTLNCDGIEHTKDFDKGFKKMSILVPIQFRKMSNSLDSM